MADPTLYLFDGYNLLHAGGFADRRALRDVLASYIALRGARGILVFDGVGPDEEHGGLQVRYADPADALLERLASEHRASETVRLVTSDRAVRGTSGQEVTKVSSRAFLTELAPVVHGEERPTPVAERIDAETRARHERLRRNQH